MVVTIHTGRYNSNLSCQVGDTDRGESGLGGIIYVNSPEHLAAN